MPINTAFKDPLDEFAKGYCFSIVHLSVMKMLSHTTIIEMYETLIEGMRGYHQFIMEGNHDVKLVRPVEVTLNKNNIDQFERALLDIYWYDTPVSIYSIARKSPFWSIMHHNNISKFQTEYSGSFLRVLDQNNLPISVPNALKKMKGVIDTAE